MRVAGLPSSDVRYFFPGRRRKMQVCVQGEFKRRVRFDKVLNGQEFAKPFVNVPARRVVNWAFGLVKSKMPSTFRNDFFGASPYFLSPLAADMQAMSVERAGGGASAPQDVRGGTALKGSAEAAAGELPFGEIREDCALLGEGVPAEGTARRKYFGDPSTLEAHWFEPGLVYTFNNYQARARARSADPVPRKRIRRPPV